MPSPRVIEDFEVVPLLTQMALDKAGLIEAVRYAHAERKLCTANDANGFEAITVYDKTARGLREIYGGGPWEKDESNGQAGIQHVGLRLRIVPCNFDEDCASLRDPSNRSPKGEVSKAKAMCNATGWLFKREEIAPQAGAEFLTWILGVRSVDGEPLRAELSLPIKFDSNFYTGFAKRIILLDGSEDDETARRHEGPTPTEVVDIPIVRK